MYTCGAAPFLLGHTVAPKSDEPQKHKGNMRGTCGEHAGTCGEHAGNMRGTCMEDAEIMRGTCGTREHAGTYGRTCG